jgi:hypothetical protein
MVHDEFKIIANGRELPYPVMRLVGLGLCFWVWGLVTGLLW